MRSPAIYAAFHRPFARLLGRTALVLLAVVACLPRTVHAQGASVVTQAPDPNHPILSQAFQDATDQASGRPLTAGNRFELLETGVVSFPRKLALIRSARAAVFFSSMLGAYDRTGRELADALVDAVGRGVDARVIFDALMVDRRLARAGAEIWEIDVPIHSKVVTVDGVMASIGSYNLSTSSDRNIEGVLIAHDPALVRSVESMFARDLARAKRVR